MARSFLTTGCSAINAADLQFIPTFGRPPELAEEVQAQSLAVLSQLGEHVSGSLRVIAFLFCASVG